MARSLGIDVRTYRRYESGEVNSDKGFEVRRNASRRQLLRRMCDELGVADEEAWLTPSPFRTPEPASPRGGAIASHALLRANHFVGRARVLRALSEWVGRRDAQGMFAIVAVGGAGKTAVVERFVASEHREFWVHSFYDDPRTEPAVNVLAAGKGPVVVLDGVEAVQSAGTSGRAFGEIEDASLRRALRAVCSGVVKQSVIVTSRFPLSDFAAGGERAHFLRARAARDA